MKSYQGSNQSLVVALNKVTGRPSLSDVYTLTNAYIIWCVMKSIKPIGIYVKYKEAGILYLKLTKTLFICYNSLLNFEIRQLPPWVTRNIDGAFIIVF